MHALPILLQAVVAALYAYAAWLCWPRAARDPRAAQTVQWLVPVAVALHAVLTLQAVVTPAGLDLSFSHALSLVAGLAALVAWSAGLIRALPAIGAAVLPVTAVAALMPVVMRSSHLFPYGEAPWATAHIAIALAAYAIFIVAAALTLVLTQIERRLHSGLAAADGAPPPLLTLERWLFRLVGAGFVLLTLTVASGLFFSEQLFGQPLQLNQKNVFSVAAWLVFGALLVGRWRGGWRGRRALKWIVAGTVLLLCAYIGNKFIAEVLATGVR
ncbi:MAG: cytochrome c biogenesis protein CcsA [Proteobacteria bacterium]|nr:cytochrome c biogenesis protein CcsA [Pseudomonadota bacterium]